VDKDRIMRGALRATAIFNVGGALAFLFPASVGQLAGLPAPETRVYSTLVALFAILFCGAYAWLARQPRIDRPLVAFAALGKSSFFVVVLLLWLSGALPGLAVLTASGDLLFALIFAWWLLEPDGTAVTT
jgi:hypothetical protein